jgi:hypothetical protein
VDAHSEPEKLPEYVRELRQTVHPFSSRFTISPLQIVKQRLKQASIAIIAS